MKGKMKEGAGRTVIGTRGFVFVLYRSLKGVLVVTVEVFRRGNEGQGRTAVADLGHKRKLPIGRFANGSHRV